MLAACAPQGRVENQLAWTHVTMSLLKYSAVTMVLLHWFACFWNIIPQVGCPGLLILTHNPLRLAVSSRAAALWQKRAWRCRTGAAASRARRRTFALLCVVLHVIAWSSRRHLAMVNSPMAFGDGKLTDGIWRW